VVLCGALWWQQGETTCTRCFVVLCGALWCFVVAAGRDNVHQVLCSRLLPVLHALAWREHQQRTAAA